MIYFEPKTGRIVKYIPYEESSLGFKLYFWTLALHTGKVNPFFKLIQLVAILSVLYLGYLGISAYFNRKLRENTNANQ
jgi:vanillate O-demethylase ferredoxin subunit